MSSPRSEKSQTRFSTPVSDLDDHRTQTSIPVINTPTEGRRHVTSRRGTIGSSCSGRVGLLQVDESLRAAGSLSRDFEQSAIDEDDSRSRYGDVAEQEQGRTTPTSRRGISIRIQGDASKSRERSPSGRSLSPPNSIDAFANTRRRERTNTFGSRTPSDLDLTIHRTISGGTHRRRPTFSNGSCCEIGINNDSDLPEDDVCFPHPDEPKIFSIDFPELENFAASRGGDRTIKKRTSQRYSFNSVTNKPEVFQAYAEVMNRNSNENQNDSVDAGYAVEDDPAYLNEKQVDGNGEKILRERQPSVAIPNRFSYFSSEIEQTIHAPEFRDLIMPGETFKELFQLPSEGGAWWVDVMNPTEDELEVFQKAFGIHRLTIEDIERQEIREKVELFNNYYFVCFRSFYQMDKSSEDYLKPVNLYMVVFRSGILTFTITPSPHATSVLKRIGKLRNYIHLTADWICYAMIDNIVDSFGPVIHDVEIETDQIEDQVFVAREEDFVSLLRQIGECRKRVMSLMRLLGGKADVIKGFAKRCNEQYSVAPRGDIGLYLGDIQDHVVTMMSNLGHFEKMLSRSHTNYLAQLSVDHIAQGNRANKVLSKITFIATVLVPLNLICGLFGMNVPVPGRESTGLGWFFGILGIIAGFVAVCICLARRYRYL